MKDDEGLRAIVCLTFDHRAPADGVRQFKDCLIECPQIETYIEVSGTYDLILQIHMNDLTDYRARVESIRELIQKYVARYETNFVLKLSQHNAATESGDQHIWVKCEEGFRCIEFSQIDRITAERDYVRIHTGDSNCLHHSTIRKMLEVLSGNFLQLHRSSIVRRGFIERFIHEKKAWRARLKDGTLVKVSKSHVNEVLTMIGSHSSSTVPRSSLEGPSVESPLSLAENPLH